MRRAEADLIVKANGWLSVQPPEIQNHVLGRSLMLRFDAGAVVYRMGDDPGGIYGLVSGSLTINCAPPDRTPQLLHIGYPGGWTGEGCFISRQPRRLDLRAHAESWLLHLPLDQMDQLADADPRFTISFAQILMGTVDTLVRIVSDLQHQAPARRIAAVIERGACPVTGTLPLTQAEIGKMSCTSRRQVNAVLKQFSTRGWISTAYGGLRIVQPRALRAYIEED